MVPGGIMINTMSKPIDSFSALVFLHVLVLVLIIVAPGYSQFFPENSIHDRDNILEMATNAADNGNYYEARRLYISLLDSRFDDTAARAGYAKMLMKEKRYDEANAEYLKIIFLNPREESAILGLSKIAFLEIKYEETLNILENLFHLNPDHETGRILQAKTFFELKQLNKTWEIFSDMISRYLSNTGFLSEFIKLLLKSSEIQNALEVVQKIPSVQPEAVELRFLLVETYRQCSLKEKAKLEYEKLLEYLKNNPHFFPQTIEILLKLKLYEDAEVSGKLHS